MTRDEEQRSPDLLSTLGGIVREQEERETASLDPRWASLSAGDLDAEEVEALRRAAKGTELGQASWEAFRPLGGDFHAQVAARIRARDGEARTGDAEVPVSEQPRRGRGNPGMVRALWALAAVAVLALGLGVLLRASSATALPGYVLELGGAVQAVRDGSASGDESVARYVPGNRFRVVLRPRTVVEGTIVVRLFLANDAGTRPWRVGEAIEVDDSGAVRVEGVVGETIEAPLGTWQLWAVVGRPGAMPDADAVERYRQAPAGRDTGSWQVLTTTIAFAAP